MTWKIDETGSLVKDKNGNPIFGETSVDGETISRLNGEAKTNRLRAEAAEKVLKDFDGVDIEKIKNVDEIKNQLKAAADTNKTLQDKINSQFLENAFNASDFIKDKIAIPGRILRAAIANHFSVENERIVARDDNGQPIYSTTKMGELADFDEALEKIINSMPEKASILKGANQSGTGNNGAGGESGGGIKTLNRAGFDGLKPGEKSAFALEISSGKAVIKD